MRPTVRILLPVWGEDYIQSFQKKGLRSLLAAGNIPAMAQICDTEFVFLTPMRDAGLLKASPFFKNLESVCRVVIEDIEDLLIDNSLYGYILTYAYHRGILSAGKNVTKTHFVFIVSDYVFSENSFGSLARLIASGSQVILSGSLRVDEERAAIQMRAFGEPDQPLVIPPRKGVALALQDLHPSLDAKIVNDPVERGYSSNYQHLYWRVDKNTLISKNFMAHMLCIQPSEYSTRPRGFCDYTFIPDMAPGARLTWLDDSDDYLALELQEREHESGFLQRGQRVPADVANSLSAWTTAQHRDFADHTFVYHALDVPSDITETEVEAKSFIDDIKIRFDERPKPHLRHPHWEPVCEMIVERAQERWRRRADNKARGKSDKAIRKFNFAMQVWGRRYIDVMLNVGLPSQLSPGNLLNFPWLDDSVYEFYTTKEDAQRLRSSLVFRFLQVLIEVRIIYIDDALTDGKWANVRYCHRAAVDSADQREAAVFFMCPDQVWPDGSIGNAARLIDAGYSAVMCPGPRAVEEVMVPLLRDRYLSSDGITLNIPPRELVKAGIDYFHPEMKEWVWDNPEYFGYPSYAMFDVPGHGILAHCYILHPVVVNAEVRNAPFLHVFDQDYLRNACPDVSKIYVASDSDDVFHFELSPRDVALPPPARANWSDPVIELMWYGEKQFNSHHREFVKTPIRIHYRDIEPAVWAPVEQRAATVIGRIDSGWTIPDWLLAYTYPDHLIRRLETRHRFRDSAVSDEDQRLWDRAIEIAARRGPTHEGRRQVTSGGMTYEVPLSNKDAGSPVMQELLPNAWRIASAPSGALPSLMVGGPDVDELAGALFGTSGGGSIYFNTDTVATQFEIAPTSGASNHLAVTGGSGSNPPVIYAAGNVDDLDLELYAKGTGSVAFGSRISRTLSRGLSATGTEIGTACRLTSDVNYITTAEAHGGVVLPKAARGLAIRILNGAERPVRVYADGLADIDGASGIMGLLVEAGECFEFVGLDEADWVSVRIGTLSARRLVGRTASERLINIVGRFDARYYARISPELDESKIDLESHYRTTGWREGRDPSPYFSVRGYLASNQDVAAAEVEPLDHFVKYGLDEGRTGWESTPLS